MGYTIGNFIISIKNAGMARRRELFVPYSNIAKEVGKVLAENNLLKDIKEETEDDRKALHIFLLFRQRMPVIRDVRIVSKPSLRIYEGSQKIANRQRKGALTVIISTNKGIKTSREVQKEGLGGEVLFEIW